MSCGFFDLANISVDRHVGFLSRLKNLHACAEIICMTAEVAKPTCFCRKLSSEGCSVDRRVGSQMSEDCFVDRHVGFLAPPPKTYDRDVGF